MRDFVPLMRRGDVVSLREAQCPAHGAFNAKLLGHRRDEAVWSRCGACLDEEVAADRRQQEAELELERRREWLASSGVHGTRFEAASFDAPNGADHCHRAALARCQAFAAALTRESPGGLVLLGPTGVGKTHLAAAVVRHAILERGLSARLITARDLVGDIRETWRRRSERGEAEVLNEFRHVSLLAIDDLGAGFGTEAEAVHLLDVLDARYRHRRPTLATSNLTLPELKKLLSDRAFDRLLDGSSVIPCDWHSLRRLGRSS